MQVLKKSPWEIFLTKSKQFCFFISIWVSEAVMQQNGCKQISAEIWLLCQKSILGATLPSAGENRHSKENQGGISFVFEACFFFYS